MTKRDFIRYGVLGTVGIMATLHGLKKNSGSSGKNKLIYSESCMSYADEYIHEARFYEVTEKGVRCTLCANNCLIREGKLSGCHTRITHNGKLYTIAYGNPCSVHVDPIEKKPLLHFYPETEAYSISTAGCNLSCLNCQNWEISQVSPRETNNYKLMPEEVIQQCLKYKCKSIAYTYSEPIAFYEYTYDTAKLARQKGIKNVLVSNGFINEKPLRELCRYIDAANINLKSFDDKIYINLNNGRLKPVLETLKIMKEEGVWLEITNLIVPTWTDNMDMIKRMCDWIVENGLHTYPLHVNRFYPMYKLQQLPDTPVAILEKARDIAVKAGIRYVYIGNVPGHTGQNTYCPKCKKLIVERKGYRITQNNISGGSCKFCKEHIHGYWS
jgi:pyruvate formate lyase activating enzyme